MCWISNAAAAVKRHLQYHSAPHKPHFQESGVVFKGNLRSKDPAAAYQKMKDKLKVGGLGSVGCRQHCSRAVCITGGVPSCLRLFC